MNRCPTLDAKLRKSLRLELKKIQKASRNDDDLCHPRPERRRLRFPTRSRCFIMEALSRWERRGNLLPSASEFVTTFIGDTNRMTESLITQLNEQNKGAGLNPSDHIYVRVENVKESVHAGEENRYYKLAGQI